MPREIRSGPYVVNIPDDQLSFSVDINNPAALATVPYLEASRTGQKLREIVSAYSIYYLAPRRLAAARRVGGDCTASPADYEVWVRENGRLKCVPHTSLVRKQIYEIERQSHWEFAETWSRMSRRDREKICRIGLEAWRRFWANQLEFDRGFADVRDDEPAPRAIVAMRHNNS